MEWGIGERKGGIQWRMDYKRVTKGGKNEWNGMEWQQQMRAEREEASDRYTDYTVDPSNWMI